MSPALANFLFEAANFLLLAAALGWLMFAPVRRMLDSERTRYVEERQRSERLRSEAESSAAAARAAQQTAEQETAERRREALAAAQKEAARVLDDARREQAARMRALEREIGRSHEAEAAALADMVGRVAAESVKELLAALRGPSLDLALVGAAASELAGLPAADRREAVVESARPLCEESRKRLAEVLGEKFEARVVGELGAGVRVTTPAGQVDATAVAIARRAAQAVRAQGNDIEPSVGDGHG